MINPVIFNEALNIYLCGSRQYERVTKVLKLLQIPFDREGISMKMAFKQRIGDESQEEAQRRILKSWDDISDETSGHGNKLHLIGENFIKYGQIDKEYPMLMQGLKTLVSSYYKFVSEDIIYLHNLELAGRSDIKAYRQKGKNSIVDYYDFKTNIRKGIVYDSVSRKDGVIKHYNKKLLPPLDHLEDCNYIIYCLQLSVYALMDEMERGITPGKMAILFMKEVNLLEKMEYKKDYVLKYIPVPYMKLEAMAVIEHYRKIKNGVIKRLPH